MALPDDAPSDVPFSLVCQSCDAGIGIESFEAALAAGWTEVCFDPDLPMANFIGLCPECRQWEERQEGIHAQPPSAE